MAADLQEKLLRNYIRLITEDLEEAGHRRRRRSDSDGEEEVPRSNSNLFHTKEILHLPRWRKAVAALLDAEDKSLRERLTIFHTMAQAYTATLSASSTSYLNTSPIRSAFINYLLYTFSLEAIAATKRGREIPEQVSKRLKTIARLWFHALLQGYETCQLVGFHDEVEPWLVWQKMQTSVPVPELWSTLVLQYVAYEAQHNYLYGCFYVDDMHYRLTAIQAYEENEKGSETEAAEEPKGEPGSSAKSDFVKQTYNFKTLHDEYSCVAHPSNPLFQRRFWHE